MIPIFDFFAGVFEIHVVLILPVTRGTRNLNKSLRFQQENIVLNVKARINNLTQFEIRLQLLRESEMDKRCLEDYCLFTLYCTQVAYGRSIHVHPIILCASVQ